MHTHHVNSKTATTIPPERWVAKTFGHLIDQGHYNVACQEAAHAHYGDKFTRRDACVYFVHGAMEALGSLIGNSLKKGDNDE